MAAENPFYVGELIENVMLYLLDASSSMLNLACASKLHNRIVHSTSAWLRLGFSRQALLKDYKKNDGEYVKGKAIANILATRRILQLRKELEVLEGSYEFAKNMGYEDLYPALNRDTAAAFVKVCNYAYDIVTVPELVDVIRLTKAELKKDPVRPSLQRMIKIRVSKHKERNKITGYCHVERNYPERGYLYAFEFAHTPDLFFQAFIYKNFTRNETKSMTFINTTAEYRHDGDDDVDRKLYFFIYNHVTDLIELCGDFEDYMTLNEFDENTAVEKLDELLYENDASDGEGANLSDENHDDTEYMEDPDQDVFLQYFQISHFGDCYEGSNVYGKDSPLVLENLKLGK